MATNEWTLMFYFGSDNALAPSVVSQIKSIKDAGFQLDTNVLVYFDPNEKGAPTRLFNVNRVRKQGRTQSKIGDGRNPFVFMMGEDDLDPKELKAAATPAARTLGRKLATPDDLTATEALSNFLDFCREAYPAKHYALFLVGHGLIVGNDAFLPDENPDSAITLKELGHILRGFARHVRGETNGNGDKDHGEAKGARGERGEFELVGMHSCCMSAVEVAYELRDTARYMMATEGISFVGGWPYRQFLKKIFNAVEKAKRRRKKVDVPSLVESLHKLCFHSASNFLIAGFSADLCLCDLSEDKFKKVELKERIQALVRALKNGLKESKLRKDKLRRAELKVARLLQNGVNNGANGNGAGRLRLAKADLKLGAAAKANLKLGVATADELLRAEMVKARLEGDPVEKLILLAHWKSQDFYQNIYTDLYDFCSCLAESCDKDDGLQGPIKRACEGVMEALGPRKNPFDGLVVFSDHAGPTYQYSHGLSIYFPWSMPVEDARDHIIKNYRQYDFTTKLGEDSWLSFLELYFDVTQRLSRREEDGDAIRGSDISLASASAMSRRSASVPVGPDGNPSTSLKVAPADSGGGDCVCSSVKNYPNGFSLSEGGFDAFDAAKRKR
jgi:Clostripain family